jgi:hypothetical protein
VGAGFSRWSCDLPLVGDLFDLAIHVDNEQEERRLRRLEAIFDSWRTKNPESHVELFIAFAQQRPRSRFLVNWYVVRRLTDQFVSVTGRRKTFYINSYRAAGHPGVSRARALFARLAEGRTLDIVTTNYDMVPEYALSSRGMNYGRKGEQIGYTPYPYIQPVYALGEVRISKLHGSVSWHESGAKGTDSRYGLSGKCLIVPPVSEKTAPPLLRDQWKLARRLLSEADILIVFGFSFNANDQAVRRLVSRRVAPSTPILFVDAVDRRQSLPFLTKGRTTRFLSAIGKSDETLLDELTEALSSLQSLSKTSPLFRN